MTKRMLIDAVRPEEIRVVVTQNDKVDDFDSEASSKRPIKGNIYLAKVTRVEPSLQAAFVEYGGNRQAFLPFSEIHYDYFQIPTEDKQKLEDMMEKESREADDDDDDDVAEDVNNNDKRGRPVRNSLYRKYKIQEVIKRNQIILIQVIKEERGNKGASVTTYLSLPGKYCVLMPKTDNQGGISRKVMNMEARKRLRQVVKEINPPKGMSVIIRTAGADRTKGEVKRDFSYLLKLWEKIRDNAINSTAPAMVYEEGDIIKRSIRDMYDSSIDEVIVEGATAFKSTKNFMSLITPGYAKNVKEHQKKDPIFWSYDIEDDLAELYSVEVGLKSGGYIVLNPTEALVAIDVNSGKATKERNVESTAVKTNIEAAEEIARQLRLRDLAGLIVIDFIDMLELKNKKKVERVLKDALARDRAKIQIGRISNFGLLEMSRQRLGSSVVETSTVSCPRCRGLGVVSSKHTSSVNLLREIEHDARTNKKSDDILVFTSQELTDFMKKEKKSDLKSIEKSTESKITIKANKTLLGAQFAIGEDALSDLIEAIKEGSVEPEDTGKKPAKKSGDKPVRQDDVKESEIESFEGDDELVIGPDIDITEDNRPQRHQKRGGPRDNNRNRKRPEHRDKDKDKSSDDTSNIGNSKNVNSDKPDRHQKPKNRNNRGRNNNNGSRGRRDNNRQNPDDNIGNKSSNSNVHNIADNGNSSEKKNNEISEKERSVIKSIWKRITD